MSKSATQVAAEVESIKALRLQVLREGYEEEHHNEPRNSLHSPPREDLHATERVPPAFHLSLTN
jgi:hypothetical protein